ARSWRVRYIRGDGSTASVSGFGSRRAAEEHAAVIATGQRRGIWLDPARTRMTFAEWASMWLTTLDLDVRTVENYRSRLRCHLLPRWGDTALAGISTLQITVWIKDLADAGYAPATIAGTVKLLSMMLADAVDERLIPFNPVRQRRRRGRRARRIQPEKVWATPEQVLRIAAQATALAGQTAGMLIVTAAWTGCRSGERAGLHRSNLRLDDGLLIIDPYLGALHESAHQRWLGPPKTAASARTVTLPPFLIGLLRQHLARYDHDFVFTAA